MSRYHVAFLILLTLTFNVVGNVLLKIGAVRLSNSGSSDAFQFLGAINLHLVAGASSFGLGLICYVAVLSKIPLNLAQTVFSLQFVSVIVAAAWLLNEPISASRWLGIVVIFIGLLIVAYTAAD